MSDLASHTPADPALVAHLTAGIAEARSIYELLFPTQQLFFVLSQGNNPIWAAPEVIEGPHNPRPQDLGADYLGTLTRPGGALGDHLLLSGELSGTPGAELLAPQTFYEELLCALPAPVAVLDAQHRYVFCNPAAIASPEVRRWIIGRTDAEYVAHRQFAPELAQAREYHYLQARQTRDTVFWEETFGAPPRTVQLRSMTPVFGADGALALSIGHGMDITELRRTQDALRQLNNELEDRVQSRTAQLRTVTRQLRHDASHDALTGLPNRTLFSERLDNALARSRGPGAEEYAVLFLDTDRFKGVNDTLGHPAGDALLRELSARLLAVLRPGDTLARLGGDEFAVLLTPLDAPEEATDAARICGINALAAIDALVGLGQLVKIVKVTGFVASAPGFTGQPLVVNGASELFGTVLGELGRHARSAVGVSELPLGAPVEVEVIAEVA